MTSMCSISCHWALLHYQTFYLPCNSLFHSHSVTPALPALPAVQFIPLFTCSHVRGQTPGVSPR